MEVLGFPPEGAVPIDRFESQRATASPLARVRGTGAVGVIRLAAGGVVGRHPTVKTQLFIVIEGDGVVSGEDGLDVPIGQGHAALWRAGESHESRTASGMTAIVIELDDVQPAT